MHSVDTERMDRVNWRHISEDDFNRLVENLLVRKFTRDGLVAYPLDGRGGDGGIDIAVRVKKTGQLIRVFQLKHFPEGFSGGWRDSRRPQIKKSLLRVIDGDEVPDRWTLVTPRNTTLQERKSVVAMRPAGVKLRIDFMGTTDLDLLLAEHPEIQSWFLRDEAVEVLRAANRESALLAKPGDLFEESQRIHQRLDARSIYWGTAFSSDAEGNLTQTLVSKRPDAPEREPLSIHLDTRFSPDDEPIRTQLEESFDYGLVDLVRLPEHIVQSVKLTGPEWFAHEGSGSVELWPVEEDQSDTPVTVQVRAGVDNRRQPVQLGGTVQKRSVGARGVTVRLDLDGGLTQTWRLSTDGSQEGSVQMQFEPASHSAREVRRALRFISSLSDHRQMSLTVDSSPLTQVTISPGELDAPDPALIGYLNDLCAIEDLFDVTLRLPEDGTSAMDRLWARVIVMVMNRQTVILPGRPTMSGTLNGEIDAGLEQLLTKGVALFYRGSDLQFTICGTTLTVDQIAIGTPHAVVDDAERLLALLRKGQGASEPFDVRPADGWAWVIYRRSEPAPPGSSVVQPWAVPRIPEHPAYDRLASNEIAGPLDALER